MASDLELLQAWRDGDLDAGEELFERYFDAVTRFFANKLGDQTTDLVQATFEACVKGRDRISNDSRFRSYLFSTARNVLFSYLKRRYRLTEDFTSRSIHDIAPGAETKIQQVEEMRLLQAALRRLPMDLQIALELKFWEGMKSTEISKVLDVPASTIRTWLTRALEQLRTEIENLSSDPDTAESTNSDLDAWAEKLRKTIDDKKTDDDDE